MDGLTTDESRILGRMHAECEELREQRDELLVELGRLASAIEDAGWHPLHIEAARAMIAKYEGK